MRRNGLSDIGGVTNVVERKEEGRRGGGVGLQGGMGWCGGVGTRVDVESMGSLVIQVIGVVNIVT